MDEKKREEGVSVLLGVKTHRLKQKDIDWVRINGTGGRDGTLLRLLPLLNDEVTQNPGVNIAEILHATPLMQKTGKTGSDHCCFEMWMTNKKATLYFWARDQSQLGRVIEQYKTSYPGMSFEEADQYFPVLREGQYCTATRLQYKKHWTYPLGVIGNGEGWKEILGATATDQPDIIVIVQILIKPLKREKSWKGKMVAVRRKTTTQTPDSPYTQLTNLISSKADKPPFYVEIRTIVVGDKPDMVKKKTNNILGAFQRFSSDIGGNLLKPVPCNVSWCVALNAVEDRSLKHFVTPIDYRMRMGTDELGQNFLSIPIGGVEPLQYTHVWKRDMPEDVEKTWTNAPIEPTGMVKVELCIRELTPEEQEIEAKNALLREIEVRGETKEVVSAVAAVAEEKNNNMDEKHDAVEKKEEEDKDAAV